MTVLSQMYDTHGVVSLQKPHWSWGCPYLYLLTALDEVVSIQTSCSSRQRRGLREGRCCDLLLTAYPLPGTNCRLGSLEDLNVGYQETILY